MAKTALVGLEISDGAEVVSVLERHGIPVQVALWMETSEYEEGRLAIASMAFPQEEPLKDYERLASALQGEFVRPLPPIRIFRMSDPFIVELRAIFGHAASAEGMRLGGQRIGNRYIEDAYVYKIS